MAGISAARFWLGRGFALGFLAGAIAFACGTAAAQDNKPAVPVEATKVVAAPLSEQVTAVGALLSNKAVTISSEIAR